MKSVSIRYRDSIPNISGAFTDQFCWWEVKSGKNWTSLAIKTRWTSTGDLNEFIDAQITHDQAEQLKESPSPRPAVDQ